MRNPTSIPDRFKVTEDPEKMIFIKPGDPKPEVMIMLDDGSLVPESVFGSPPADLPVEDYETWYENREDELLVGDDESSDGGI